MNDFDVAVLALTAQGCSRVEVARRLGSNPRFVGRRLRAVRHELQAATTIHAAALAVRAGIVP